MRTIFTKKINDSILSTFLENIKKPNLGYGPWIAGGAARMLWFDKPWYEHDIDLFFPTVKMFNKTMKKLDKLYLTDEEIYSQSKKYKKKNTMNKIKGRISWSSTEIKCNPTNRHVTPNATTYRLKINNVDIKAQIINRQYYESLDDIWNDFDFRVCNFATDGKIIIADANALQDCENNVLICNEPLTRKIDVKRTIKYSIYGFNPEEKIMKELVRQHKEGILMEGWKDDYP